MRKIFIVIPADTPHGPVKGAYALANALARQREVTLVSLKKGPGAAAILDERVKKICLADRAKSFREKVRIYRGLLSAAGGRHQVSSISMCLSADALNAMCASDATICSSVRSNLMVNYRMDYGVPGTFLAVAHLISLRRFDHVVAMSPTMAVQIQRFSGTSATVIGNFIDELPLERFRRPVRNGTPIQFAFVGSLSERKQPRLIVQALASLHSRGIAFRADLVGDGPLRICVEEDILRLGLQEQVRIHGFLSSPYEVLGSADVMVLPSLSEGISRAALESLFLGVPCVLRKVDGNSLLISDRSRGALFSSDVDLADAMLRAATASRENRGSRPNLLPSMFRQDVAARMYLRLLYAIH